MVYYLLPQTSSFSGRWKLSEGIISSSPPLTWRLMLAHRAVCSGDSGLWHHVNQGICLCNGNVKECSVRGRRRGCNWASPPSYTKSLWLITQVLCSCVCLFSPCSAGEGVVFFREMFITHKHHIRHLSASECKPCSQPCGPPSAQLSVQPHAPSGTGSSSSLTPTSVAEDVFFGSTNEDQVKLCTLDLDHFYFLTLVTWTLDRSWCSEYLVYLLSVLHVYPLSSLSPLFLNLSGLHSPPFCLLASLAELQDACSVVSDYDCPCAEVSNSVEDLLALSSSLRDSEYFKDLEGGIPASHSTASPVTTIPESKTLTAGLQVSLNTDSHAINHPAQTSLTTPPPQVNAPSPPYYIHPAEEPHHNFVVTQLSPKLLPGCIIDSDDLSGPAVGLSLTINLNGLLGSMETAKGITGSEEVMEQPTMDLDGEPDLDSFPILVRSMSTSRRHSWGVPVSPINLGRR